MQVNDILTFIKEMVSDYGPTIMLASTLISGLTWLGKVTYKKYDVRKQKEITAVDDLMKLFNDSTWTFRPTKYKTRDEVIVTQPLTHLFKSVSIKSATTRCRIHESHFIKQGLICNHANETDDLMYRGAVKFDIDNRDAVLKVFERGDLPKSFMIMKSIFYTEFRPHANCMNMDCVDGSLNNVLLNWKEIILKYDKTLVQRYPWLQWQPYI